VVFIGVRRVNDDRSLADVPESGIGFGSFIGALEAILIEGLEPPQNLRSGEGFTEDIEWQQKEDPTFVRKRNKSALMDEFIKQYNQG
jgi:hypothetical protein